MALFNNKKKHETKSDLTVINNVAVIKEEINIVNEADTVKDESVESKSISIPFDRLATFGSAFSSIIPSLRTVTEITKIDTTGLYKVVNNTAGETLKIAKNGDKWGSFVNSEGKSVMARFADANSLDAVKKTTMPVNPAMIMMAMALNSIEENLDEILEMEKKIFSFLQREKESEIEGDFRELTKLMQMYKFNCDNEQYRQAVLNMVMDIQARSNKSIIQYQKQLKDMNQKKGLVVKNKDVDMIEKELANKFGYYRMAMHNYVIASMMEIVINENFQKEYILQVKDFVDQQAAEYIKAYENAKYYLDKLSGKMLEANVVKGLGTTGQAISNVMGKIPLVNKGTVDTWIGESGMRIKQSGEKMEQKALRHFEVLKNPGTTMFVERLDEINWIYNHSKVICCDKEKVWLE